MNHREGALGSRCKGERGFPLGFFHGSINHDCSSVRHRNQVILRIGMARQSKERDKDCSDCLFCSGLLCGCAGIFSSPSFTVSSGHDLLDRRSCGLSGFTTLREISSVAGPISKPRILC